MVKMEHFLPAVARCFENGQVTVDTSDISARRKESFTFCLIMSSIMVN